MANFIEKLFRVDERVLKKYSKMADHVLAYEEEMSKLSDEELQAKTPYFKERLANGETLEDIKYEAMAVAREAARRTLGQFPYKVQAIGALVMHDGDVAEMRTGEGKTLTATMAIYLNALEGKGAYVVTVNEYLAQRDAEWMGQIYRFLGLTVGCNIHDLTTQEKKQQHLCDICYTTNSELGFDYLRDNMATTKERRVLRGLHYAVVDEADSILIDESRTPLIISGQARTSASSYKTYDLFAKALKRNVDFEIDIKDKTCSLTEAGNKRAEQLFGVDNLYGPDHQEDLHRIQQALKANYIMTRDVEYMVDQNGEIQLIDQSTGRILKGREYSDGLQQAIQAKENVKIKEETVTMATITYQNFFRLFKKMSGMTGTAKTEEEEFQKIYNMRVVVIPTNKPIQRIDAIDYIYAHKAEKLEQLVQEVKERHEKGQPILIGTVSVESSEEVSALLDKAGLKHETLNAKNHAREAEIIAHAGEKGAITVATNMAGRGTDIKINDEVKALGGLCVFGTERHESRRIDNQLRGRSGRQGDPGFSRFYVSFDDDLLKRFAAESIQARIESFGPGPLESKLFSAVITNAQKQIEGQNFDIRKNLLDYDDVISRQRNAIYEKRDQIMFADDITDMIEEFFRIAGSVLAAKALPEGNKTDYISGDLLKKVLEPKYVPEGSFDGNVFDGAPIEDAAEDLGEYLLNVYNIRRKQWGEDIAKQVERDICLQTIDQNWTKQIDTMARLREGIHLRSYANTNPLQDYVNEGQALFRECIENIAQEVVFKFLNVIVQIKKPAEKTEEKPADQDVVDVESKEKE